ncbi:MAG: cupin domain-containing protein [Epulopiscium sp.]|nr:cupin domain-containing protein [Candidatus Epulonipiscium sp.]
MNIGEKIKLLRITNGLTQEELANRCELTKGFISQVERDLTSPSIATLVDILECLGTNLKNFFNEAEEEKIVFHKDDIFIQEDLDNKNEIHWIIPNAQKNHMEPIMLVMEKGGSSIPHPPHEGEEFGYVLSGNILINIGNNKYKAKKGETFCFKPSKSHFISNTGNSKAKILWVCTPPSF